ncbi:hypothetical protein FMN50_24695 [Rhodobacterales bacterium]|nr:hypothetical protein FMN50_24695 [Rhodobacterales bacterium]
MNQGDKSKGHKSTGGGKPLRSRGYLSRPGGGPAPVPGEADTNAEALRHKSRGARQISASRDKNPEALETRPSIKPYRLDDT